MRKRRSRLRNDILPRPHKAKVCLTARSSEKSVSIIQGIKTKDPNAEMEFLPLDLTSLNSVRDAAERILAELSVIDMFVCDAGVIPEEIKMTEDRVETDFQTNYLSV